MYKLFPCLTTAAGILLLKNIRRKNACHASVYSTLHPVDDIDDFKWNDYWRQGVPNGKVHHVMLIAKSEKNATDPKKEIKQTRDLLGKVLKYFKDRDKWHLEFYSCPTIDQRLLTLFEPSEDFVVEQGIVQYREALDISFPYDISPNAYDEFSDYGSDDSYSYEDEPVDVGDTNAANHFIKELFAVSDKNRLSIIIAHRNLIKYLVFKTLQLPLDAYRRTKLDDFSVTWLTVDKEGKPFCSLMNQL